MHIIQKDIILHTIDSVAPSKWTGPFYASYERRDVETYRIEYAKEIAERIGPCDIFDIRTKVLSEIAVPSYAEASGYFNQLYGTSTPFRIMVRESLAIFLHSFQHFKNYPMNEREEKVYQLLKDASRPFPTLEKLYDAFIVSAAIDNPVYPHAYRIFYDYLKYFMYGAIVDVADVKYNSYQVENPVIIFDITKVSDPEVTRFISQEKHGL